MRTVEPGKLPKDLLGVRRQFDAWRRRRRAGDRIPQALWALAVGLVSAHGISRTSAALGVDYYSLKKQADVATSEPRSSGRPAFVELSSPLTVGKQCLFELDNGAGATLRVQLVSYDTADVETLARTFWTAQ
jgi:hypothetical protein